MDLQACRVCLAMDVKLHPIDSSLNNYMKNILQFELLYSDEFPAYFCFECAFMMKKFYYFKQKCIVTQTLMQEILQDNNQITKDDLAKVDRSKMKLESNLRCNCEAKVFRFNHDLMTELTLEEDIKIELEDEINFYEEFIIDDFKEENYSDPDSKADSEKESERNPSKEDGDDDDSDDGGPGDDDYEPGDDDDESGDDDDGRVDDDYEPGDNVTQHIPKKKIPPKKPPKKAQDLVKPLMPSTCKKPINDHTYCDMNSKETTSSIKDTPDKMTLKPAEKALEDDFSISILTTQQQCEEFAKRKHSSNYKDSPHKCDICYTGFFTQATLDNHMVRHALKMEKNMEEVPVHEAMNKQKNDPGEIKKKRYSRKVLPQRYYCTHSKNAYQCDNVSMQDVQQFNKQFFTNTDKKHQDDFIIKYCKTLDPARRRIYNGRGTPKLMTIVYNVTKTNGEIARVCQNFFLTALSLKKGRVRGVLKRHKDTGMMALERRGGDRKSVKFDSLREAINSFINKFKVESQYCHSRRRNIHLPTQLTIASMFKMFIEEHTPQFSHCKESYFRNIFHAKFS